MTCSSGVKLSPPLAGDATLVATGPTMLSPAGLGPWPKNGESEEVDGPGTPEALYLDV